MASKLPVWGIDVGQCSLKAIKLQLAGEQPEMLTFDVVEHEKPLAQAGGDSAELVKKAIATFVSRNEVKDSQVVISVPGQQTLTRFTKMPPVEAKKIPDMVQYEASQQIPFDMDEVIWDYQVFTEADSPDVEVGIFAIRKELIRNYISQFTGSGIEPAIVQSSPMASYNAARFEMSLEPKEAMILLDMGALATDLIVMEGSRIWSRPIPIGGNRFTEALVSAFKISFDKGERLKRNAAASKHARQIFQAMRPVLADLVSEIQRSIGFYTSTHRETHIARVVGMGNAFKLPGLQKFLQQNLQIEVERLTSLKKLVYAGDRAAEFGENVMSFPVAYGLALQGLDLAAVSSSLLPYEVRRTLLWRKKEPWFAASAGVLALSAVALWVGNVMASGQISGAFGSLGSLQPVQVDSLEQADQIVNGGAVGTPLERAVRIAGAAARLEQEYNTVASARVGDVGSLEAMAKLTENNVFVPRIIDVIHRAFEETTLQSMEQIGSAEQYRDTARTKDRRRRREVWIREMRMRYDAQDPGASIRDESDASVGGPGWLIGIIGETTTPAAEAPTWLADTLLANLDRLGKAPGKGFYVANVRLMRVTDKTSGEPVLDMGGESAGRGRRGIGAAGGRGAGGAARGRPTAGGRPTTGGGAPRGRAGAAPAESGRGAEVDMGAGSVMEQIQHYRDRAQEYDPLTGEAMGSDQWFEVFIVVRKGDTPNNLIPDAYKTAETSGGEEQPARVEEPNAPPRRD